MSLEEKEILKHTAPLQAELDRQKEKVAGLLKVAETWHERWNNVRLYTDPATITSDPAAQAAWKREQDLKVLVAWHILRDMREVMRGLQPSGNRTR